MLKHDKHISEIVEVGEYENSVCTLNMDKPVTQNMTEGPCVFLCHHKVSALRPDLAEAFITSNTNLILKL